MVSRECALSSSQPRLALPVRHMSREDPSYCLTENGISAGTELVGLAAVEHPVGSKARTTADPERHWDANVQLFCYLAIYRTLAKLCPRPSR